MTLTKIGVVLGIGLIMIGLGASVYLAVAGDTSDDTPGDRSVRGEGVRRDSPTPLTPLSTPKPEPARLMFCEPLQPAGQSGGARRVAVFPNDVTVVYEPGSCRPNIASDGGVLVRPAGGEVIRLAPEYEEGVIADPARIVWTPATGMLDGRLVIMTGAYLRPEMERIADGEQSALILQMTSDGQRVYASVLDRIVDLPVAIFVDGEPFVGQDVAVGLLLRNDQIADSLLIAGLSKSQEARLRTAVNSDSDD